MKLVSFRRDGVEGWGAVAGDAIVDMSRRFERKYPSLKLALANPALDLIARELAGAKPDFDIASVTLLPPVPDPDNILSTGFFSQISSAVAGLTTNGAAATIASTLATASSNAAGISPFSGYMSQSPPAISAPSCKPGKAARFRPGYWPALIPSRFRAVPRPRTPICAT